MEELKQTVEQIQSDLKDIKDNNSKTNLRLQKLESVYSSDVSTTCTTSEQIYVTASSATLQPKPAITTSPNQAIIPQGTPGSEAEAYAAGTDINGEFRAIKSAMQNIQLPHHFTFVDSRQGIRREDQLTYNILARCAQYTETNLKILNKISTSGEINSEDFDNLVTVNSACISYIKDEHALLLVKGQFDDQRTQMFRTFQRGTSPFTEQSIQNLQRATAIT